MEDIRIDIVEIKIRRDGKVLWLNDAHKCIARVCGLKKIYLRDDRLKMPPEGVVPQICECGETLALVLFVGRGFGAYCFHCGRMKLLDFKDVY